MNDIKDEIDDDIENELGGKSCVLYNNEDAGGEDMREDVEDD
jgi:hypothetical protein